MKVKIFDSYLEELNIIPKKPAKRESLSSFAPPLSRMNKKNNKREPFVERSFGEF